ncbi:MAG: protein kinase, partial [Blastocatellia bacterium]|nr:protein kinase [Blastocatellia bacterium]
MSPERWQKINELFEAVLEHPVEERAVFLAQATVDDEDIRRRVEGMIAADTQDDLLIDRLANRLAGAVQPSGSSYVDPLSVPGSMVGVYRLISELGRGGMGTVYLAADTRLGRRVALKLLPSRLGDNPERVRRFHREARTASALNHPNIITIYDFGNENGCDYIASEFVEGRTLRDYLVDRDHSLSRILDLVIQVASALAAAHEAGIVHRDIKPENIMLRPDGYVKVLDFGLAKLSDPESGAEESRSRAPSGNLNAETRSGVVVGTVNYMSPEQVLGEKVDWRSDLFSLGILLYELITGKRPFCGETCHHTMVAIIDANPPPISDITTGATGATADLQKIINRALAKDRGQRYQSASALMADLEAVKAALGAEVRIQPIKSQSPQHTIDNSIPGKIWGRIKSTVSPLLRKRLIAVAAVITLTALAATVYFYFGRKLSHDRSVLTDKDTILLTDFANTTGDAVFDDTLKYGLLVQLRQSPYFNILSEERARETL